MASLEQIAEQIRNADQTGNLIAPIRDKIPEGSVDTAYEIQSLNTRHHVENGRKIVGRKIGLTSPAVQKQLGVDEPDFGILYQDMQFTDGDTIPWPRLHQPKIESEIAVFVAKDLPERPIDVDELHSYLDFAVASLEIPGSRIANWDINICDTVADNASSGVYALGKEKKTIDSIDWKLCGMVIRHRGEPVSTGCGAACLGSPLIAATWLVNKMLDYQMPLKAGDVILTGALGPMVNVQPGQSYETEINGVGSLSVHVSESEPNG